MATVTEAKLEEAKRLYLATADPMKQLQGQLKELRSTANKQRRVFKKYMQQQKLQELVVGPDTFSMEKKERIVCTMERVENAFDANAVANFKKANTEVKVVFKAE